MSTSDGAYGVSFRHDGHASLRVKLTNISSTGCALEVPMDDAMGIEVGSVLKDLYLDHPDLPYVPLQATVVRILGKVPGKTDGYVLMGADFTYVTPLVQGLIQTHVEAHLVCQEV